MLRRRCLSLVVVLGTLSAVWINLPVDGRAATSAEPSPSAAIGPDIEATAKLLGVSVDEATYRIKIQQEVGVLEAALNADLHDVLGSVWITQEPQFGVHVSVLPGYEKLVQPYLSKTDLEPITTISDARRSLSTLRDEALAFLDSNPSFGNYDLSIDEIAGYIDVVAPSKEALDQLDIPRASVTNQMLNDFQFDPGVLAQAADVIGGRIISDVHFCTAGFVVRTDNGNQDGVADAGHCDNAGQVWNNSVNLTFQEQAFASDHDVQWFTTPGVDDKPWFNAGDGGSIRHVLSLTGRANTSIGDVVCKYGVTAGYHCGEVIHKDVCPGYVPGCYPDFIQADTGGTDMCLGGDSGGPVFYDTSAYGMVSGDAGDADHDCIYMAINFVTGSVVNPSIHVRIAAS